MFSFQILTKTNIYTYCTYNAEKIKGVEVEAVDRCVTPPRDTRGQGLPSISNSLQWAFINI